MKMQRPNSNSMRFEFDRPRSPGRPGDTRPAQSSLKTKPGQPPLRPKPFAPLGNGGRPRNGAPSRRFGAAEWGPFRLPGGPGRRKSESLTPTICSKQKKISLCRCILFHDRPVPNIHIYNYI